MISLRAASEEELPIFVAMENQVHANQFVNSTGLASHRNNFKQPEFTYLSIEDVSGELAGYFILVKEAEAESVEFHRILIDRNKRGIGQTAIAEMENYCKKELNAKRIWLDVYEDNEIGRHIYEKMGYKPFKASVTDGRKLLFYEKAL